MLSIGSWQHEWVRFLSCNLRDPAAAQGYVDINVMFELLVSRAVTGAVQERYSTLLWTASVTKQPCFDKNILLFLGIMQGPCDTFIPFNFTALKQSVRKLAKSFEFWDANPWILTNVSFKQYLRNLWIPKRELALLSLTSCQQLWDIIHNN